MSKGDYIKVKSEIGGKLETAEVTVKQNGGKVESEWDLKKNLLHVRLLNRAGNPTIAHSFAIMAVRHVEESVSDE